MNKHLYLPSGFLNFKFLVEGFSSPFTFIIGGRGTGKTYGAISYLVDTGIPALFMRRTQEECDTVLNNPVMSTALQVLNDRGYIIDIEKLSKKNAITYYKASEDAEEKTPLYISCSLTGAASIRGISSENIKLCIYDEFIKERHKKAIAGEGFALFNAYETFNRNRELSGKPPIKFICMSNSDNIFNPVFKDFGILDDVYKMIQEGKEIKQFKNGLVNVIVLGDSPISELKSKTVLYQIGNEEFNSMAIENAFETPDEIIKSMNIKNMRPICSYGKICFYRMDNGFYVSKHRTARIQYGADKKGKRALLGNFPILKYAYNNDLILCEDMECAYALEELFI